MKTIIKIKDEMFYLIIAVGLLVGSIGYQTIFSRPILDLTQNALIFVVTGLLLVTFSILFQIFVNKREESLINLNESLKILSIVSAGFFLTIVFVSYFEVIYLGVLITSLLGILEASIKFRAFSTIIFTIVVALYFQEPKLLLLIMLTFITISFDRVALLESFDSRSQSRDLQSVANELIQTTLSKPKKRTKRVRSLRRR